MKTNQPILSRFIPHVTNRPPKIRWWQAALFLAAVTVLGRLSGERSRDRTEEIYDEDKKPAWSPPAWLFGPAWAFNSICLTWAGVRLLNAPTSFPHRRPLLILQAVHWLDFVTFGYVYFRKRSPILALVWTQGDAIINTVSFALARKGDPKLAWAYVPVSLWTGFASTVSYYIAMHNPDRLLGTPALVELLEPSDDVFWEEADMQ